MLSGFIQGILAYFNALGFITKRGYGKYFLYTGLIGLVLFAISLAGLYQAAPYMSDFVLNLLPWDINIDLTWTSWISFFFTSILFISIFKYGMLICTAPIMSAMSAKVEYDLTGEDYSTGGSLDIVKELLRSLRINLRNLTRELFLTVILLLLGLIPVLSIFSAVLIVLVQSYYAGFGNYDFWAERHFTFSNTLKFMKTVRGHLCGNGIVFVFLLAIPILGAFIAPPLATVAATIEGTRQLEYLEEE